jgi:hypothetical protein
MTPPRRSRPSVASAARTGRERASHGAPTFFVGGKRSFVTLHDDHHGDGRLAIWCPASDRIHAMLARADPDTYFVPLAVAGGRPVRH